MLTTGCLVAVTGRLDYTDWETEDGIKGSDWELIGLIECLAPPSHPSEPQPLAAVVGLGVA
jgi:hypothetical protein